MKKSISLAIATPTHRQLLCEEHVSSLVGLTVLLNKRSIPYGRISIASPDISLSRDLLASQFLGATTASHLLMIDDDIGFDPKIILEMISSSHPVVSALCPLRKFDWDSLEKDSLDCGIGDKLRRNTARNSLAAGEKGEFVKSYSGGAGILLIARDVLVRLIDSGRVKKYNKKFKQRHSIPYETFSFFSSGLSKTGEFFGEDRQFLQTLQSSKIDSFVYITDTVRHVGEYVYQLKL